MALLIAGLLALSTALVPPPGRVKYVTDKGDVTFDHPAHVARRETCRACHGEGPVQKIAIDKASAHRLCVGCHLAKRAGPKACSQCHDDA